MRHGASARPVQIDLVSRRIHWHIQQTGFAISTQCSACGCLRNTKDSGHYPMRCISCARVKRYGSIEQFGRDSTSGHESIVSQQTVEVKGNFPIRSESSWSKWAKNANDSLANIARFAIRTGSTFWHFANLWITTLAPYRRAVYIVVSDYNAKQSMLPIC